MKRLIALFLSLIFTLETFAQLTPYQMTPIPDWDSDYDKMLAFEWNLADSEGAKLDRTYQLTWLRFFVGEYLREQRLLAITKYNEGMATNKTRMNELLSVRGHDVNDTTSTMTFNGNTVKKSEVSARMQELSIRLSVASYETTRDFYSDLLMAYSEAEDRFKVAQRNWYWLIRANDVEDLKNINPENNEDAEDAHWNWIGTDQDKYKVVMKVGHINNAPMEPINGDIPGYGQIQGSNSSGYNTNESEKVFKSLQHYFIYVANMHTDYKDRILADTVTKDYLTKDFGLGEKDFNGEEDGSRNDMYFFNFSMPGLKLDQFRNRGKVPSPAGITLLSTTFPFYGFYCLGILPRDQNCLEQGYKSSDISDGMFTDIKEKHFPPAFAKYLLNSYLKDDITGSSQYPFGPDKHKLKKECLNATKDVNSLAYKNECPQFHQFIQNVSKYAWAQGFVYSRVRQRDAREATDASARMLQGKAGSGNFDEEGMRGLYFHKMREAIKKFQESLGIHIANYQKKIDLSRVPPLSEGTAMLLGNAGYGVKNDKRNGRAKDNKELEVGKLEGLTPGNFAGGGANLAGTNSSLTPSASMGDSNMGSASMGGANLGSLAFRKQSATNSKTEGNLDKGKVKSNKNDGSNAFGNAKGEGAASGAGGSSSHGGGGHAESAPGSAAAAQAALVAANKAKGNTATDHSVKLEYGDEEGGGSYASSAGSESSESLTGMTAEQEKNILESINPKEQVPSDDDTLFAVLTKAYVRSYKRILTPKSTKNSETSVAPANSKEKLDIEEATNLLK